MKILQGGIVTSKENIRYLGKKSFYTTATAFIVHSAHHRIQYLAWEWESVMHRINV